MTDYPISTVRRLVRAFAESQAAGFWTWQAENAVAKELGETADRPKYVYYTRLGGQVKRCLDELSGPLGQDTAMLLHRELRNGGYSSSRRVTWYEPSAQRARLQAEGKRAAELRDQERAIQRAGWESVNAELADEGFFTEGKDMGGPPEFSLETWQQLATRLHRCGS